MSSCRSRFSKRIASRTFFAVFALTVALHVLGQSADWGVPFPAFRIAGNLYYVGDQDLASYLVATPQGLILMNSNLSKDVPLIQSSIEQLGFHFKDVKILLISHAHYDHAEGSAAILQQTGAKYFVMDGDVPTIESGGTKDFQYAGNPQFHFPPANVDRILHDGDRVELGGSVLTAHLTAGHTKGTTTWTMDVTESGRTLHVVIVGSPNVNPGYKLVGNKGYPQIATDYRHGFALLKSLPCDIFLGAHGSYYGLKEKYARWKAGDRQAFVDPAGYKIYINDRERAFQEALRTQLRSN